MNIVFESAPNGTTHFLRYASGYIVWCKIDEGQNNQLILSEWDSGNEYWVPGIFPVEHYQKIGLTNIDDLPNHNDVSQDAAAPKGATHRYQHGGETGWYRETEDNLFVWRDGSWYASTHKSAASLAKVCPFGAVTILNQEVQLADSNEDDLTWLARNVHVWPFNIFDAKPTEKYVWNQSREGGDIIVIFRGCPSAFTKNEWLARRAELQNKPTDWPEGANWLAQDSNGEWNYYTDDIENLPQNHGEENWFSDDYVIRTRHIGEVLGDWRDTLERRPEKSHADMEMDLDLSAQLRIKCMPIPCKFKFDPLTSIEDNQEQKMQQDNGWFERGELPPVGTECEFCGGTGDADDPWHPDLMDGDRVTVIAHFECGICTLAAFTFKSRNPNIATVLVEQANYGCFRPIRTERDELMDVIASQGFLSRDGSVCGQIADIILAAGFKRDGGAA